MGKEADKSHAVLESPTMFASTAQSQSSAPEQGAMLGYRFWDSVVNSLTFDIGDLISLTVEKQNEAQNTVLILKGKGIRKLSK